MRNVGHWGLQGFGIWTVRERDGGRFVGEVGAFDFKRSLKPSFEGAQEMGWGLPPWLKGKAMPRKPWLPPLLGARSVSRRAHRLHDRTRQPAVATRGREMRLQGIRPDDVQGVGCGVAGEVKCSDRDMFMSSRLLKK